MRRVIVTEWMSLDGVVQAPGAPDEDTTGGFKHGGWHLRYFDDMSRKWVLDNLNDAGGYLFGRRTYEAFASHWPNASEEEQSRQAPQYEAEVRGVHNADRPPRVAELEAAERRRSRGRDGAEAGGRR